MIPALEKLFILLCGVALLAFARWLDEHDEE